jgi:hypothetical protein
VSTDISQYGVDSDDLFSGVYSHTPEDISNALKKFEMPLDWTDEELQGFELDFIKAEVLPGTYKLFNEYQQTDAYKRKQGAKRQDLNGQFGNSRQLQKWEREQYYQYVSDHLIRPSKVSEPLLDSAIEDINSRLTEASFRDRKVAIDTPSPSPSPSIESVITDDPLLLFASQEGINIPMYVLNNKGRAKKTFLFLVSLHNLRKLYQDSSDAFSVEKNTHNETYEDFSTSEI